MSGAEARPGSSARAARSPATGPAPVFAALGDVTRLRLVARLNDGRARSITQLAEGLGQTRQGVTKHLRVLEEAGLVSSIRVGRESRFAFLPEPVARARSYLEAISLQWDDALNRLQRFVEDDGSTRQPRRRRRGKAP